MNDSPRRFGFWFWMFVLAIPTLFVVVPIVFSLFSHAAFPLYPKPLALLGGRVHNICT
jgi:hypothetical protein